MGQLYLRGPKEVIQLVNVSLYQVIFMFLKVIY